MAKLIPTFMKKMMTLARRFMPDRFLTTLHAKADVGEISLFHDVVRRDVFEVRATVFFGTVFFQCACCKHLPRSARAEFSTIAPQSVETLYRAFVKFTRHHVPACEQIPQSIKDLKASSRDVSTRGTRKYWVESAMRKGLADGDDGSSIAYYGVHPPRIHTILCKLISYSWMFVRGASFIAICAYLVYAFYH
eukprot:CAMPEP_0172315820 /NCGR_PEP_ID=MMETSP1058-20130122/26395_1 /TAXON_ID=83371 /ORGANISM="Detonula confervacea, Strain CCMP 353" /LENGTH=191 /DNA_ID=CAMNT_0013029989 /DNA_START=31 /DNA_END=606 /DNA_ORIENTATION=+